MKAVVPSLLVVAAVALTSAAGPAPSNYAARAAGEDILAKSMAVYDGLTSYADSGTAMTESVGTFQVGHFRTFLRRPPLSFYFEWGRRVMISTKQAADSLSMPGKKDVYWLVNGDLQVFRQDGSYAEHKTYPRGTSNQSTALAMDKSGTMDAITLIPSLLFRKAKLVGPLQEIAEISLAGTEQVGGHPCHKLVGIAQSVYPSGAITNVRPITVWIDTQTLMIRKVFTDTPKNYPLNGTARATWTVDPTPNPKLDDSKFQFTIPDIQRQ
jgi:outer membrane lipoprotein-sorting protein